MELKADDGCRGIRRHLQTIGPDREHREQIAVRMVAGGRARNAVGRRGGAGKGLGGVRRSVRVCSAPGGSCGAFGLPASAASSVTFGGMFTTSQCQNPLPVGASGSKQVMAKLFVPAGAPDHARCGDWLLPAQPKPKSAERIWVLAR